MEHISASRLKLLDRCPKKFWGKYGVGVDQEESTALHFEEGRRFHETVEHYVNTGEISADPFPLSRMMSFVEILDPWLPNARTEVPLSAHSARVRGGGTPPTNLTLLDFEVAGFVDLWSPRGILDYKTMRNGKYALNPEDLPQDIQLMMYAKAWTDVYRDRPGLFIAHAQYVKSPRPKDPRQRLVEAWVTRGQVKAFWEQRLVPLAQKARSMWLAHVPFDEMPNTGEQNGACWDYGGCPFSRRRGDGSCKPLVLPLGFRS